MKICRWTVLLIVTACVLSGVEIGRAETRQADGTAVVEVPEAAAPHGLARIEWPSDAAGIEALFGRLPTRVANEARTGTPTEERAGRFVVAYGNDRSGLGPPLIIQAVDVSTGDFWPADWTADRVVHALAGGADWTVEAVGRDGDLVWIRWRTTAAIAGERSGTPEVGRTVYTLNWGRVGEPWLFGAAADTPERLDALVTAFVAAASVEATTTEGTPAP